MVDLPGYEDFVLIYDSVNSRVYRARRVEDQQPIILKFVKHDYPSSDQVRRYKQEYKLISQLESPGIIKAYGLESWQNSYAIALEDFGAISLRRWLQEQSKISLTDFLSLAISITDILGQIHAHNIIHKDINPDNIVLNPETKELKIIDFGISTQLTRENPTLKNPNILEGTLPYISPEQTGRMNRELDYRTDFYSLGVTLYEMLTQKLPFKGDNALELVHCHIAQTPPIPETSYPVSILNILMKLMAKNAEDRYQSTYGLKADLENCLQQLKQTKTIIPFSLGEKDISDRFQIPQKLYGRHGEIATLLAAFERVNDPHNTPYSSELMLVAGYSGIGKSSLVAEIHKPITEKQGYFIAGKYDQYQRDVPYSAVISAFRDLVKQLLSESEEELEQWRQRLLNVLGSNGQVMINVVPEIQLIVGPQPPVPALGPTEAQNRFNLVFQGFMQVFCDSEHPLVLFLDDLQWADSASFALMQRILTDRTMGSLLVIGAYRDNEVGATHPLMTLLKSLQEDNITISTITLKPLSQHHLSQLISDTVNHPPEKTTALAELVWQKTEGNPFFVTEFLKRLYSDNLLNFSIESYRWEWDIDQIQAQAITNNVVELLIDKLKQLPLATQEVLRLAACIGAQFDLNTLTLIYEQSEINRL